MQYILGIAAVFLALYYYWIVRKCSGRVVRLIYFELIYNLVIKFLIGNLHLPSMLNYVSDVVLVWILIEFFHQKCHKRIPKSLSICFICLCMISLISYILNIYSPLLYIWGFRNNFRFILYAMMCAVYLKKRDAETVMRILFGFFCFNIIVVTYQYFFVSYSAGAVGDFISGLFSNGNERGGNASLCWLMIIVCTYTMVKYLNKTGSLATLVIALGGSVYIAALSEIKIFYLELIIVGIVSMLLCRKSLKALVVVVISILALIAGVRMLYYFFPKFADFFTYENMLDYVTRKEGYSNRGYKYGIDRLTALPYVLGKFLTTPIRKIFGIGLGNADYSQYSFLSSSFYRQYSWSGYSFFYASFITVEMGLAGLLMYIVNLINYMKNALQMKGKDAQEKSVRQFVFIVGILCIISIFANQTMKLEASAYMVYMILAMPFSIMNDDKYAVGYSIIKKSPFPVRRM